MNVKYRIHNAPTPAAIEQAARLGMNWAIVHSVGPCGDFTTPPDPITGRMTDEFPQYFDDYPRMATIRRSLDAAWLEPFRRKIGAMCDQAASHGIRPAFHFYEPMLPLVFETEYPEIVGRFKRQTQHGVVDVHSHLDPDNPATWDLMTAKYRELARDFPQLGMVILTTWDGAGSRWCIPKAKMPIHERLVKMVTSVRDGVREVRDDIVVVFRLWGRNWPEQLYGDGHRLIGELTGLDNATDLMSPIGKPHNDPAEILPKVFAALPDDVPVMYKSTRMDIHDASPLTLAAGAYPPDREQIIEISYEMYHAKPWPWCKVQHLRAGLAAVKEHDLIGFVALPINMGNNRRGTDPETGNLGRMNTWMLERLDQGDQRSDVELVGAWLEHEFGSPQPEVVVDALLDADDIADKGCQWGGGIYDRQPFASLHTTKLYWMFDGFIQPDFPSRIAEPDAELIELLIGQRHEAYDRACTHIERIQAAQAAIDPALYVELIEGYQAFADVIVLRRDWSSYLLMQYAIEKGVYPPEREVLGRMSRYVETFISNLLRLKDTAAGQHVMQRVSFPDRFDLS